MSEVSQTEKEKYQMTSHMWNLKRTYFQNRKRLIDLENELMWEGIVRGFGKVMYTLLCSKFKIDKRQRYCIAHGTPLNVMCQPGWREVWERMDTCICMDKSLHYSHETATTLLMDYIPIQSKKSTVSKKN